MPIHSKIAKFDQTQESWDMYIERLELYFVANSISEAEQVGSAADSEWALNIQADPKFDSLRKTCLSRIQ